MLNIAIVEDDKASVALLQNHIHRYSQLNAEIFTFTCFENGLDFLEGYTTKFDIVFMDSNMPVFNGMQAAKRLRELGSEVPLIFITNMAQYALKSYEVNALDFILKPIQYADFQLKLKKTLQLIQKNQDKMVMIKVRDTMKVLSVRDICYIEVRNHSLYYHTVEQVYETSGQLKAVEEDPKMKGFAKCSNYCLVNLRHVSEISNASITVNGTELPLSRRRKTDFMKQLTEYI